METWKLNAATEAKVTNLLRTISPDALARIVTQAVENISEGEGLGDQYEAVAARFAVGSRAGRAAG